MAPEPLLEPHFSYLTAEFTAARAAPLSRRKAMLVAMLADAYADRLFAAEGKAGDILRFRDSLAATAPALRLVFDLCSAPPAAALVIEAVEVPAAELSTLTEADFMVSLYNGHTVQRLLLALPDGTRLPAHAVLAEAIAGLAEK